VTVGSADAGDTRGSATGLAVGLVDALAGGRVEADVGLVEGRDEAEVGDPSNVGCPT
jgi:hypothetical protein